MKYFILTVVFFVSVFNVYQSYAINSNVESAYENFTNKIEARYSIDTQRIILESVRDRAVSIIQTTISPMTRVLMRDMLMLNNESLYETKKEIFLNQDLQKQIEDDTSSLTIFTKIPYTELSSRFQGFFTPEVRFGKVGDDYYGYNFNTFRYFEDSYGVREKDLEASGFSFEDDYIFRDENGRYNIVSDIKRDLIAREDSVDMIANKIEVLDSLRDDARYTSQSIPNTFEDIRKVTLDITNGKNYDEKVEAIYAWILENISYSENFTLDDEEIFSAIETFERSSGVCTGYTKLMLYMLSIAGIQDVEVIRGQVIDAPDFPVIGHAWIRIGDRYYDPTFDDPVGLTETKTFDDYTYFGLPRDIFYANRFEYDDLPESFKTKTDEEIRIYIFDELRKLLPKYQGQEEYENVFAPIMFRQSYNISSVTELTPELLSEKLGSFTVNNNSFTYDDNGSLRRISAIRYFKINDENTTRVLDQLMYDIDNLTLFNWETSPGIFEWRLAYELETR